MTRQERHALDLFKASLDTVILPAIKERIEEAEKDVRVKANALIRALLPFVEKAKWGGALSNEVDDVKQLAYKFMSGEDLE